MKKLIHYIACVLILALWIAAAPSAGAGMSPLSDADLDGVSAQGVNTIIPIAVAAPTTAINFSPVSTGTVANVNTITNTNTQLLVCVFANCVNSGLTAANGNSIVAQPTIVSPQTNNFLNSLQSPAFASTSSSGMTLQVPTVLVPNVQVPTVQVPTVQAPTINTPGFRFTFP